MPAKTILITGCSTGGIGYSLVQSFQKRGLTVFATARNLSSMGSLSDLPNVHLLPLDVTSATSISEAFDAVKAKTGGKLDYLVNNAGALYTMPALDSDIEKGKNLFDTNFWGVLMMVQVFSPLLVQAKGTVVNIGSALGYVANPYTGIYNASKAALQMLDSTLRLELAPLHVSVLTVITGVVKSSIMAKAPTFELPPNSYYLPINDTIKARAEGQNNLKPAKTEDYAESVVSDVLGGKTGRTFRGGSASLARFGSTFFPTFILDHMLLDGTGLPGLAKNLKKE